MVIVIVLKVGCEVGEWGGGCILIWVVLEKLLCGRCLMWRFFVLVIGRVFRGVRGE